MKRLSLELNESNGKIHDLELSENMGNVKLTIAKKHILDLKQQLSAANNLITQKENEKLTLSSELENLQAQNSEKSNIIESNREQLELKDTSIAFLNDECREQVKQLEQQSNSIEELKHELTSCKANILELNSSMENMQTKASLMELETKCNMLENEKILLTNDVELKKEEIVKLLNRIKKVKNVGKQKMVLSNDGMLHDEPPDDLTDDEDPQSGFHLGR